MLGVAREWWFALALGAAVTVWLATLFTGEGPQDEAVAVSGDPPRYVVEGGTWRRMDENGQPLYRVQAERIRVYADERVEIEEPVVDGLGEHEVWHLQAPRGSVPAFSRQLTLEGGVAIRGTWSDGQPLSGASPRVTVDAGERSIRSDEAVQLDGPGRRIRGVGMRADWSGDNVQLLSQVKVEYRAP